MPIGLSFRFQEDDCVPNPRKSKHFKKAMESKPRKEGSGCSFHILRRTNNIQNQVDSVYEDWWNNEVFPRLNKIQMKELLSSEDTDFRLEQPAPIPKHTKNDNAKEIDPSRVVSQRTFQKRALDIPNDRGPKRLKFTFSSTRNVPSSERVEKIPGIILVSEDSNSGDQASRRLEATLVPEDSSSEDQNNENLDIIDALDGIDGIDGLNSSKDLLCDYPSHISGGILASKLADINDEGEVNSGTSVVKILENEQEAPVTPIFVVFDCCSYFKYKQSWNCTNLFFYVWTSAWNY
ncbi:Uncharacterized protein Adt_40250 [Abeliophyllum distichum]|uniref:Uncharacterized protein n=1 Tax=Abeliophyllum distichum TaxID=126358 RepID=A0ABD1Q7D6_9LAMI